MDVVFLWIRNHPGAMQLLRISLQTIGYRLNHEQIIGYCLIRKRVWSKRPGSGIVLGQCSCFIITSRYIVRPDIQICFSRLIIVFLVPGIFFIKDIVPYRLFILFWYFIQRHFYGRNLDTIMRAAVKVAFHSLIVQN